MTQYALDYLQRMTEAGLPDSIGLEYHTAREATPRWFGVSFGDGNNGVSHLFPSFYVRCTDGWRLARTAILAQIKDEYKAKAVEAAEIDGEEDYTIYAMIRNPLNEELEVTNGLVEPIEDDDEEDWCSVNGAWFICEVFPVDDENVLELLQDDDVRQGTKYMSMEDAFNADELKLGEVE